MTGANERFYPKVVRMLEQDLADVELRLKDTLERYDELYAQKSELNEALAELKRINDEYKNGKGTNN